MYRIPYTDTHSRVRPAGELARHTRSQMMVLGQAYGVNTASQPAEAVLDGSGKFKLACRVMIRIRPKPESITDAVRSSHNYL